MTAIRTPERTALPSSAAAFHPSIPLRQRYDHWIAGEYVAPARGQYFVNLTPITGQPLCEVARGTHAALGHSRGRRDRAVAWRR